MNVQRVKNMMNQDDVDDTGMPDMPIGKLEPVDFSSTDWHHKNWHWWDYIEHWWYIYFWNWFSDIPRNIKYFFQRGIRGYSDCDLWGMHSHLTDVILNMLVELRSIKHGYPATPDEKGEWSYDEQRWDSILEQMIDGFALLKKLDTYECHLQYGPEMSDDDRKKMEESMREKYPTWRFTTREEDAKIKHAFELFHKYYHNLWD